MTEHTHTKTRAFASAGPDGVIVVETTVIVLADGTEVAAEPECKPPAYRTLCPKRRVRPAPKAAGSNVVGKVKLAESDLARYRADPAR
ncbi:MAG: hypothetical protein ACYTFT_03365 [Planctomycetota bacterium]|jgi:hypothetical protein